MAPKAKAQEAGAADIANGNSDTAVPSSSDSTLARTNSQVQRQTRWSAANASDLAVEVDNVGCRVTTERLL